MAEPAKKQIVDFYRYPSIGGDDWRYAFAAARVRALETQMVTRSMLLDMANAAGYEQAVALLVSGEYAPGKGVRGFDELENLLRARRSAVGQLFAELMVDERVVELFRSRTDFANMRLALRRALTGKPPGDDYGDEGNVSPEQLAEVFEGENYHLLGDYLAEAVEQAVLSYYQDKDIRRIDYTLDAAQAGHNLARAAELGSVFLLGLFRIQVDLNNVRTMLRLKFTDSQQRNVFLEGGFVEIDRFRRAVDMGNESIGPLFFTTPYYEMVQTGASYLASEESFLKLEQQCEEYLAGFLKSTIQITAGPQPIIAYLLLKEDEIRKVRLILTAKRSHLDAKLILDRLG